MTQLKEWNSPIVVTLGSGHEASNSTPVLGGSKPGQANEQACNVPTSTGTSSANCLDLEDEPIGPS